MPRGSCPWEALPAPRAARQPCGPGPGLPQTEAAPRGAPAPCTHSTSLSWSRARHGRAPPEREQAASRIRDRFTARGRFGGQETSTHVLRGPRRPDPEPDEAPTDTQNRGPVSSANGAQVLDRHHSTQTQDRADSFRGPVDSTPPKTASTPRARQGCRAQNRHSEIRHFYGQIATPLTVALKRTKRPGVRLSEEAGDGRPKRQPAGSAVPRRPALPAGPRAPRAETSRLLCPVSTPSRGFHEPTAGLRSHAAGSGVARWVAVGPWNVPRGPAWF